MAVKKEGSRKKNETLPEYRFRLRLMVIKHYCLGKIQCACLGCRCRGERYVVFYELDHLEGKKPKQVSKKGKRLKGFDLVAYLVRAGFPPGYSIRCSNCNKAKGNGGKCPLMGTSH